jgi:thymidylate kinase
MGMIIEFIGTPGAGKTTLLPAVATFLQEQGITARTVVEAARPTAQRTPLGKVVSHLPQRWQRPLLWQIFYHLSTGYRLHFCMAHPHLIRQVLSSQWQRRARLEARHHALHWFFHLIGYYDLLNAYAQPNEALLLDEGFVHRVVQMNASDTEEPEPQRIIRYVELVPRPDVVIAVHAPWQLCLERIYRRGLWERFRTRSRDEVARYVYHAHCVVNVAVDHMRDRGWPLIEIDNGREDAPPQEEIRRKLAAIMAGSAPMRVTQRATQSASASAIGEPEIEGLKGGIGEWAA